jgi:3-hydroxybutyryl-CoA dehydrogenase
MGAGIAQIACLGGLETLLYDPAHDALAAGVERIEQGLAKGADRGRWSAEDAERARGLLRVSERLENLGPAELVIEAAPENLELKRELLARLAEVCGEETILATNTSSLPVTAIAAAIERPARVCGMHFFNPPALMELVEIVAGDQSSEQTVEAATAVARRMGRTPIHAADGPGFLANRLVRPFFLEALRMLGDGVASHEQIDQICRLGGGFRMGPFELMDLVGIDVGFEVAKSFWEQSFHEPRWQPHPIQARMVAAGRHGRKVGRGYYDYGEGVHRPEDPGPPEVGKASGTVAIAGETRLADELRELAQSAGYGVRRSEEMATDVLLEIDASLGAEVEDLTGPLAEGPPTEVETPPLAVLLAAGSLAELDPAGGAVGFHALPPLASSRLIELTRGALTSDGDADFVESFFKSLGKDVAWVSDAPGLVLGRIGCQLVNEAAFAVQRGVGSPEDADTAMRLGFNWPRGPLEWGEEIGLDHVLDVLDALREELGEERYRAAPLLRRAAAEGGRIGG